MARGLGKGLDSLIPDFYDEDFDSNEAQSLEDLLKTDEDDEVTHESSEDIVDDIEDNVDEVESIDEDIEDSTEDVEPGVEDVVEVSEDDIEDKASEEVSISQDSRENLLDSKTQENIDEVLEIVNKNPRITLWSSRSAAVLRYLRKTEPEFSISKEASRLIEDAVAREYPDIWSLFEDL